MQACSLASVRVHVQLKTALPFSVRSSEGVLLLARGQRIHDDEQLDELFERGAVVDRQELAAYLNSLRPAPEVQAQRHARWARAPVAELPALWDSCAQTVQKALGHAGPGQADALGEASGQLLALTDRSPEIAMSQVVRQQAAGGAHYGITHSMNAATAAVLAARTLNWSASEQRCVFNAALTMNLSMVELQGRLAHQVSPLTAKQKLAIQEHPQRSAELLEQAGITDGDWLRAIREHHETPDGGGYPAGLRDLGDMSQLLRYADVYTALMSRRATRSAISARDAARELYELAAGSPLCQALIKSFGVFPPGSYVRLASGELGLVTHNGDKAYHPQVAVLALPDGQPCSSPTTRDSAQDAYAIVGLLNESAMPLHISPAAVATAIGGA